MKESEKPSDRDWNSDHWGQIEPGHISLFFSLFTVQYTIVSYMRYSRHCALIEKNFSEEARVFERSVPANKMAAEDKFSALRSNPEIIVKVCRIERISSRI